MQNAKVKMQNDSGAALKGDDLAERLLDFAVRVGKVADALPKTRMGRHVAGQLVRCGTSPAPNYEEARAAESRGDFIHKLRVCLKELRESLCWLRLAAKGGLLSDSQLGPIIDEATQLCKIFGLSLVTARQVAAPQKPHYHE
ncbi:MAG TPA: four helix bundle protein [Pirellulales bacterium]